MTIPDFQSLMLPLLQYASDAKEHSLRDAIIFLADVFNLSDEERKELLSKGVFITTSKFSQDAREYVSVIDSKIVLVDGEELAQLMIDNYVGVSTVSIYEIKKIDSDYFTDD